jgi:hypothetical protein
LPGFGVHHWIEHTIHEGRTKRSIFHIHPGRMTFPQPETDFVNRRLDMMQVQFLEVIWCHGIPDKGQFRSKLCFFHVLFMAFAPKMARPNIQKNHMIHMIQQTFKLELCEEKWRVRDRVSERERKI